MPDGGHDVCGNCFHFQCDELFDRQNPEAWRCSLREVSVDADPYWTTCDNCAEETSEPSGPMRAVVGGMGKKREFQSKGGSDLQASSLPQRPPPGDCRA